MIAIISNRSSWNRQFALSLMELINYTRKRYFLTYFILNSCDVNFMRNRACLIAQNKGKEAQGIRYDYLVQLDDDHVYDREFIDKFIKHNKDVVVGCTCRRMPPYTATQFKEIKGIGLNDKDNLIDINKEEGLEKIGCTGPVGMVIKVDIFDRLKFPYYKLTYLNDTPSTQGGDIYFSQMLKDANIDIWLDHSVSFPHLASGLFVDRGSVKFYGEGA